MVVQQQSGHPEQEKGSVSSRQSSRLLVGEEWGRAKLRGQAFRAAATTAAAAAAAAAARSSCCQKQEEESTTTTTTTTMVMKK